MEVYLARHGETTWNKKELLCGRTDIPLTENGESQALTMSDEVKKAGINLILTSPLQRAIQTAKIVSQYTETPILKESLLMEQDFGIFEGYSMLDEECLKYRKNFFCPFPEGESVVMVAHRAFRMMEIIKEQYYGQKLLLISHGSFCRVFHSCLEGVHNERYYQVLFENCKIRKYKL